MKIFKFSQINIEEVKILLKVLTRKKAAKKDTIKTILLTENGDFFAKYTFDDINHSIRLSKFPKNLKQAEIIPAHQTSQSFLRKVIDLWVFFQSLLRFMKGSYTIKYQPILNISFLDIKAVFERDIVYNTVC